MKCKSRFVKADDDVRQFETDKRFTYTNLEMLLPSLGLAERGLVYIGRIHQMKEFEEKAKKRGIKAIAIWSINNQDHPMTEEQRGADLLLTMRLPPELICLSSMPVQDFINSLVIWIIFVLYQEEKLQYSAWPLSLMTWISLCAE